MSEWGRRQRAEGQGRREEGEGREIGEEEKAAEGD